MWFVCWELEEIRVDAVGWWVRWQLELCFEKGYRSPTNSLGVTVGLLISKPTY